MLKSLTFDVIGDNKLHCEGCEERVETALKTLEGVNKVRANARKQRIEVLLDASRVEPSKVIEKLSQVGYEAKAAD